MSSRSLYKERPQPDKKTTDYFNQKMSINNN